MDKRITLSVSGWCEVDPDALLWMYTGEDNRTPTMITSREYMELDEEERDEYTLESISKAFATSCEGEYDFFEMTIEGEE